MIEIHTLPTAIPYLHEGEIGEFSNGSIGAYTYVSKLVMYDKNTRLAGGEMGVVRMCQLSSSQYPTLPAANSKIKIADKTYRVEEPMLRANPAFVTFYEFKLREVS